MGLKIEEKIFIANSLVNTRNDTRYLADMFDLDTFEGDAIITKIANECGVWKCSICGTWTEEADLSVESTCPECIK